MRIAPPYINTGVDDSSCMILDHMGGFNRLLKCNLLDALLVNNGTDIQYHTEYVFDDRVKHQYPNIKFNINLWECNNCVNSFVDYKCHPVLTFQNFLCSFNGSAHVSRKLLVSILHKFGWFDSNYCSKNFAYSTDVLDGHIADYVSNSNNFYRKFFISNDSEDFFQTINSFGHVRYNHTQNIRNLENKLTQSFLHVVSETMATSYYPFVTEKFLYSIVTRGLFLAYAQPEWHAHVEKYYGFKKYSKLFDYCFDSIQNPVERLIELMTMISKFSVLSTDDWQDLYEMESDTIEHNYDHYFSGDYLNSLKNYE